MHKVVQDYYGRQLESTSDLKTSACCDLSSVPNWLKPLLSNIHPKVTEKYYGCGLVSPSVMEGSNVLDLGCGSGRDVYLISQLVGSQGEVVGVDMTDEQLNVAKEHQSWHGKRFGFDNVRFVKGYIEKLHELDLEPGSFDVVISNCVINLSTDKQAVLESVHRLLKPGGEFYFSDVYANQRIPTSLQRHPVLYGECLSGALYWNDFLALSKKSGFYDPRLVEDRPLAITDSGLAELIGPIKFHSATYRLFKLAELEPDCEDYGQAVIYRGTIENSPHFFRLDKHHHMETGRVFPVCGNSWRMLKNTRFAEHFEFIGNFHNHYGVFEGCGSGLPFGDSQSGRDLNSCC